MPDMGITEELHRSENALPENYSSLNEEQQKSLPSVVCPNGPEEDSGSNKEQASRVPGLLEDPVLYEWERATLYHPGFFESPILTDWEKLVSMDRGEGIIRWSPNPARNEFLTVNVNYRIIKLFKAVGSAVPERFDFQQLSKHSDFQLVTAFDWSPRIAGLVALGTKDGLVQLLRIDDDSNDCFTLPLKLQRACQAVAFNTTGLLAVGLDRVRNDQCLQIWDVNQRLSKWDPSKKGWQLPATTSLDPVYRLEPSLAIASVKFFEDQPQTLVVGVKNQSVRIHDLRDPGGAVITFQTRCNNNLAIDHTDTNYFASSALDQPGVMIWDRRASSRHSSSKMYLDSVDAGEVPFGCALKISKAIDQRNSSYIRSIRYCRDQRGLLAVLSSSGELQAFSIQKEYVEQTPGNDVEGSPELLQVRRSHPLQYPCFHENFPYPHDQRVVSFDWMTLRSPFFQPRIVARRSNQKLDVILKPTTIQHFAFDLINFSGPVRRYGEDITFPKFTDPKEAEFVLGPIALAPLQRNGVFQSSNVNANTSHPPINATTYASTNRDPSSDSTMLRLLPDTVGWSLVQSTGKSTSNTGETENTMAYKKSDDKDLVSGLEAVNITSAKPLSSREQHEKSHWDALEDSGSEEAILSKLKRLIVRRCKNGYLFDCAKNRDILTDDPWLQDVWQWIEGAAHMAKDNGMISGSLDLSYMGVYTIWKNDLGNKFMSRLIDTTMLPNAIEWERTIESINKAASRDSFDGCKTERPHHRRLCLAACNWGKSPSELDEQLQELEVKGEFTKAAAWALFEKVPRRAVEILKRGGKDLLFIALALNLQLRGAKGVEKEDWDDSFKQYPEMMNDPYLRAIYAFIGTGDWKSITGEASLPLRDRVGVAIRNFSDDELTEWLEKQMAEAIETGDIEGIVLAGITDKMVGILAQYHEIFGDFQTATLIISYGAPLYITDYRTTLWREEYRNYLNANKLFIDRCKFDVRTTKMSRQRDGTTVIKPPPRQITLRCVRCDTEMTNDKGNTANPPANLTSTSASVAQEQRNPLYPSGVHAGISCPKCGRHLGRCAVCLQTLGLPRIDRQDLSTKAQELMKNFLAFCLKCDHASHADHYGAWFERHNECPVSDCHCPCNMSDLRIKKEQEALKKADEEEKRREAEEEASRR